MATTCDACGHRTNEVKSGGAIKDQGCRLSLHIEKEEDFRRDVLKSDTCGMSIPELDFEVGWGALSSRFTTVEGLLTATKEQLQQQGSLMLGDSAPQFKRQQMTDFLVKFDDILALKLPVTLVLDDAAGNSYIQSLNAPLDDERLSKEYYTRTFEQDDELGVNDMKTENYEQLDAVAEENES
uniref:Zinc finger ZPR1-type domain-containing protein n=1 Tax=Plectus sambesii TaxID=2011161 RepID=A0A914WI61_9BILA